MWVEQGKYGGKQKNTVVEWSRKDGQKTFMLTTDQQMWLGVSIISGMMR